MVLLGCKLKLSLVGKHAVLLLLNVGKLGVAIAEDRLVFKQHVGKALKSLEELLLALNANAVAPRIL